MCLPECALSHSRSLISLSIFTKTGRGRKPEVTMSSLGVNTGPPLPLQCHKNCPKEMSISIFGKSEKFQNCNIAVTSVHIITPTAGKIQLIEGTPWVVQLQHQELQYTNRCISATTHRFPPNLACRQCQTLASGHTISTWPKIVSIGNSKWHQPPSHICTFGHISVANEDRPNCTKTAVQIVIYFTS